MSGFSASWLALREPVDHASRSAEVTEFVVERYCRRSPLRIVDLGSGTGSNLRHLAPRFATAQEWVTRLGKAKRQGRLDEELERLGRIPLLIVDEVGYIPFDPEAASLFFSLVSSRYERSSLIVSSNKTFSSWAEIFGDPIAVAALVDRLVHHAEVIVLRGESYRLKGRGKELMQAEQGE